MEKLLGKILRRPVALQAFYAGLLVVAVVAIIRLPVALLPSIAHPSVAVWTAYPDAAPEKVERAVTEVLEEGLAGITELRRLRGSSQLGGSLIRLDFGWNTDLDLVTLEIRRQLDRLLSVLPEAAERPLLIPLDPGRRPLMVITLSLEQGSGDEALTTLGEGPVEVVSRRLEQIPGVSRVRRGGGQHRQLEVELSPERLAAHGLEIDALAQAIDATNIELAGGMIRQGPFRYAVEVRGELATVDDLAQVVVSAAGQPTVRLHQIAAVRWGLEERRGLLRLDGREVLALQVERRRDANAVETAAQARRALVELGQQLPGVLLETVVDESVAVRSALAGATQALVWGGLLAVAVLFLFLRRGRSLVALAVSVPLSLALSLVLFDLLGVSLNLLSLSGLALGVGMLVDNAIVVVEHISRLRDEGLPAPVAARRGAVEVAPAITASTLTTLAVFLPLAAVEGLAGRLFRDQALAVVCSLLASLFVALTAVPGILSDGRRDRRATPAAAPWVARAEAMVGTSLGHGSRVLAAACVLLMAGAWMAHALPREVLPASEQGRLELRLGLPTDATLELVSERSAQLEDELASWPEVEHVLADLGERDDAHLEIDRRPPYAGDLTVVLAPGVASAPLLARLEQWPGPLDLSVEARGVRDELEALLTRDGSDLVVELLADRRTTAEAAVPALVATLESSPVLANVAPVAALGVPAVRLEPRRGALMRYGVAADRLGLYLEAAARGIEATRLRSDGRDFPVRLTHTPAEGLAGLLGERVPSAAGLVPLGELVTSTRVEVPAVLTRRDRAPVVQVAADVAAGAGLAEATTVVEAAFSTLPPGVSGRLVGANETFREGLSSVAWSLAVSTLLVYLLLAAQFESLVQPLVILAVVPLALAGVAPVLWATGGSWNLMSLTGCVVLVGIAVNDAIIKVDAINRARLVETGLDEAIRRAGRERVRPVLMTTATTVLGLLPLALGWGAGAGLRSPVAVVLIGGLLFATLITLTVVPVLYRLLIHRLVGASPGYSAAATGEST